MLSTERLGRRGFAVQFNWLFVLIGGAIILGFFISLITNQASEDEERTAQKSTQELGTLLRVSLASRDTQKTVFFNKKIIFYCRNISEYYVEGARDLSERYDYNVIFSPDELDGEDLVIQTLNFKAPFRVMPFIYLTNKDIEYVFVGGSALIKQLYSAMPDNITIKLISPVTLASYPDNNYDHTVFVLDIQNKTFLKSLYNFDKSSWERVSAVVINATGGTAYAYGNISFYKYGSSGFVLNKSLPFIGLELALGGIISHNNIIYECNLKKVLQRLELLTRLYLKRTDYYYSHAPDECKHYYIGSDVGVKDYLEGIHDYATITNKLSLNNFRNLFFAINNLGSLNKDIETKTECPSIY